MFERSAGWYLIDFARSRHANPARIPVVGRDDWYYKNGGSDYRPEGCPDAVNVHDFVDKNLGKAIPYGVYDIAANAGCVSQRVGPRPARGQALA